MDNTKGIIFNSLSLSLSLRNGNQKPPGIRWKKSFKVKYRQKLGSLVQKLSSRYVSFQVLTIVAKLSILVLSGSPHNSYSKCISVCFTWHWNISYSGKVNFHSQMQILCHLWAIWFIFIVTLNILHQIYCSHFPFMF